MRKKNLARKEELEKAMPEKWIEFSREFVLQGWNKTKSYRKAFPGCKSDKAACVSAIRLLGKDSVKEYIELIKNDIEDLCGINKVWLVKRWKRAADVDITDYLDTDGETFWLNGGLTLSDLPRELTSLITDFKMTKEGLQLKMTSQAEAKTQIAKLLGYNAADKTDITTAGKPIEPARVEFINAKNHDADL